MREIISKLSEYSKERENKLLNYINNRETHKYFLILLNRLWTYNHIKQNCQRIDLFGLIINKILNISEQEKNYDNAKNCIIISQILFYEINNCKFYLSEKIRKHKWINSKDFWLSFIDKMIDEEIGKFIDSHSEIIKFQILNYSEKIDNEIKLKLSELLFSQLVSFN